MGVESQEVYKIYSHFVSSSYWKTRQSLSRTNPPPPYLSLTLPCHGQMRVVCQYVPSRYPARQSERLSRSQSRNTRKINNQVIDNAHPGYARFPPHRRPSSLFKNVQMSEKRKNSLPEPRAAWLCNSCWRSPTNSQLGAMFHALKTINPVISANPQLSRLQMSSVEPRRKCVLLSIKCEISLRHARCGKRGIIERQTNQGHRNR